MSRAKNPKYESMSLEELRANMEKSKKELEHAIHNKNILEQRKRIVERKERSHRLIVKGAEFEKVYISNKLTILHGQSDHLSRRFRSLISKMYSR